MSRILVVDDNEMNLRLVCEMLELVGHEALVATNGKEAVDIAKAELPDMILMDLRMPVMDGNNAMKHIKTDVRMRHIPVVALTANAMKGEREQLMAEGFDGYIDKPIDVNTFVDTLTDFLPEKEKGA